MVSSLDGEQYRKKNFSFHARNDAAQPTSHPHQIGIFVELVVAFKYNCANYNSM
jgi:hypothetical protein